MTGWLLYSAEGARRNRQFIRFWMDAAKVRNVQLELKMTEEVLTPPFPDFAVVRAIVPEISAYLEKQGVSVFNSACVSACCNDKWKTYQLASSLGIPFPKTEYVPEPAEFVPPFYPCVLKSCAGHGGTQVFMIREPADAQRASAALCGIPSVVQEVVSDIGRDVRIYVLGNDILTAMLRVSDTDFRSNFCLGGKAVPYSLSEREREMVRKFTDALPFGLVGIDFIFHNGLAIFNEIEDVVGCRMLYSLTEIRPVELYLDRIIAEMSRKEALQ